MSTTPTQVFTKHGVILTETHGSMLIMMVMNVGVYQVYVTMCTFKKDVYVGCSSCSAQLDVTYVVAPTPEPTTRLSGKPTLTPTAAPSRVPTTKPSYRPTAFPTIGTRRPTSIPTTRPSYAPTVLATRRPTAVPTTAKPTALATRRPTAVPTTGHPTSLPTARPSAPTAATLVH